MQVHRPTIVHSLHTHSTKLNKSEKIEWKNALQLRSPRSVSGGIIVEERSKKKLSFWFNYGIPIVSVSFRMVF